MSAVDPLKKGLGRQRFRTIDRVDPSGEEGSACHPARRTVVLKCAYRPPDADFYCWRYGVWYNLMDCCYRHARRTFPGCAGCGQGRHNLKANLERYVTQRLHTDRPFSR